MKQGIPSARRFTGILIAGDVIAMVLWVALGLASHRMSDNWFQNVVRIVAPFLIGWVVVAPFTRVYDLGALRRPFTFMRRSATCWFLATILGLALRATLFGSGFVPVFAAVTLVVTAVLVLGWRAVFMWWARPAENDPAKVVMRS